MPWIEMKCYIAFNDPSVTEEHAVTALDDLINIDCEYQDPEGRNFSFESVTVKVVE